MLRPLIHLRVLAVALLVSACSMMSQNAGSGQKFVVFFTEWSAGIDAAGEDAVRSASDWAIRHADAPVVVTGFADPEGSAEANIELSRTRAQVVYDQLVRDGVPASRIQRTARGKVDFTLSSQESRRVEISVGNP